MKIGKTVKGNINCMILPITGRKRFSGNKIIINRNDSTASASKEITECDDAGRFAIPVHNPCAIIIINNLCVTWLEISSYRWAATSYVLTVLRTTYADMI